MAGSTFGHLLQVTNFGESHGPAIGCVIDGCPPGLALSEADLQPDLDRRKPGTSRHVTQRRESDRAEILSGVFEGLTTGTPIALLIRNEDARSSDYADLLDTFRPGHADYTYWRKYGRRDPRGGGRSSARLTAPMVAAGAVAKKWLRASFGTQVRGCVQQIGDIEIPFVSWEEAEGNAFFAPNAGMVAQLEAALDAVRKAGDSVGARLRVNATGMPVGLGAPLYDKLDADIAYAMMGINAVKGVEIGAGFGCVSQRGSAHGDELLPSGFDGNNAGGVLGGISSGQDHRGVDRHQTDLEHSSAAPVDHTRRRGDDGRNARAARPLCRHSRHADRRSDAGAGDHGPCAAASRAERRRAALDSADRGALPLMISVRSV